MFIEMKNVDFIYGYKTPFEKKALENINLSITKGEFIGIIGKTGSGKSTLVQLMNGLLVPQIGDVVVDGINTKDKKKAKEIRKRVGLVFQYPEYQLFEETVYKDIAFGPQNLGFSEDEVKRRVKEVCELLEIPKELLEKSPFELSGGQKRRVAIAGILAMDPDCIILDEPTAGLDMRGRKRIFNIIERLHKEAKKTIILISHSLEDVAVLSERVIILSKGKVHFDGPKHQAFENIELLEKSGLLPPDILYLQHRLKLKGFKIDRFEYSIENVADMIVKNLAFKREGEML
ncbi:energy-coupling factor transport system ATP-binding protein [Caldicellulosiruptor bescii]|uniref:Energy-coupling factor transporter ATP-binding protein EcfA2 n=2 Tax=Caldicellulosiruptor bescii TaxID=31899 RepID=B9MKC3_CALBD|nr:energy-coupling factor transporter ATPase [Caldicellulosiruptor bescii]ACM60781.1 ABC transporter related [Caldicellulosiruptor bescii DSM 6725]PBC89403.1 energy-coupling factor transport system ATP-binding protein [Caldicellulosiruptor bescii]PBC91112.1 energy-coupling factor transport system ATP-binding protein [Caldicellulosiruptor bescii]PBD03474.1 energy-coupling factor transport system ATP-binding protein [Caldicellulosiruptor bescii]PBD06911.1 energy-coupling factor transport system 